MNNKKNAFTLAEVFNHSKNVGKNAFTLAEVLITLGIIGTVAAITMPTLIGSYQKEVYATSLHKAYNEINQAFIRLMSDRQVETLTEAGLNSQANVDTFAETYFKYTQKCTTTKAPCFADTYTFIDGGSATSIIADSTSYVLPSGASIRVLYRRDNPNKVINLYIDVNGDKKPNMLGRDAFFIGIYNDGAIDDWDGQAVPMTKDRRDAKFGACKNGSATGWGCFGKILNDNWKMKY
ncbi:MAG: type II secretion system GspH family protein [Clostridiaceae bacterium]|nr:type II secretion system GspH family protein [Clostridiaceae bacterium]